MRSTCRIFALALASFALLQIAGAQEHPCRQRSLPVSVIDEHGKPVVGLTKREFSGTLHGNRVQIVGLKHNWFEDFEPLMIGGHPVQSLGLKLADRQAPRVVVVLDSGPGMMRVPDQWNLARAIAADMLRVSPKAFRAGLIVYNDQIRLNFPVSFNPGPAADALRHYEPFGNASDTKAGSRAVFWDAVTEAVGLLNPPEFGDAIYVITDGEDTASKTAPAEIQSLALSRGIRLSLALFSPGVNFPDVPVNASPALFDIPSRTGGRVIRVESALPTFRGRVLSYHLTEPQFKALDASLAELYAETQFAMRVDIALPEELKKPSEWKLSIAAAGVKIPWRVSYPTVLAPCTPTH